MISILKRIWCNRLVEIDRTYQTITIYNDVFRISIKTITRIPNTEDFNSYIKQLKL